MAAPNKGRRAPGGQGRPGRVLALILVAMVALTGGMFYSGHTTPRLGIDLAGGTSITLTAKSEPGKEDAINETNMQTAVSIIERRVNGLGVQEAEVQTQGRENIIVNIPRGTDEKQAREQVGTTAELGFRPVLTVTSGAPAPDPSASPSASPSGTAKKDDEKAADDQADGEEKTDEDDDGTPASPSPSASAQGRALTDDLLAEGSESPTPSASASGSGKPSDAPEPSPSQSDAAAPDAGIPADVQKKLDRADCSSAEGRSKVSQEAARTDDSKPIVACDESGQAKYALGPIAVPGTDVTDAAAVFDDQRAQGWIVTMEFDSDGAEKFADITEKLSTQVEPRNQFAIVLDGEVVSAPRVSERLGGGSAEISGSFTQQSAEELANILSYGALPLSFSESSVTTVSPALGDEQLKAGLIAGAIGLALVVFYLVFYYRGLSLIAVLSLLVSAVLTYTIMSLLGPAIGFALNLPAVCGAIVAIGITADSFIVYFERIRDEIREGRTLRPAVERGWPRARRTILVSDFVSFLAAAVLFIVSVGKVQGFAFTLGLTTVLDVVVVFFFTKPLMTLLARTRFFSNGHPWSGLDPKRLGAKPPLRRGRRRPTAVSTDLKEA